MNSQSRIILILLMSFMKESSQSQALYINSLNSTVLKKENVLQILESFLFDQDSLYLFHENENFVGEILKNAYALKPTYVFSYLNQSLVDKITTMGRNEMVQPRTTKAFWRFNNNKTKLLSNLKYYSKISTNGKWIFFLRDFNSLDDAKETLIKAWMDYKMSNILLFYFHGHFNYTLTFYNPFDRSENANGKFWDFEVKVDNKLEILKRLDKTFHRRYGKKLRNFQLVKAALTKNYGYGKYFLDMEMSRLFEYVLYHKMQEIEIEGFGGAKMDNKSSHHDLYLVEEEKVDIVMMNRLLIEYGLKNSKFLSPVGFSNMNFVIKTPPKEVPQIFFHVTSPFDWQFKFLYVFMIITMVAIVKAQNPLIDVTSIVVQIIGVLSAVGVPMTKHIKVHQRITFCGVLIFAVVVCGSFQGCIVKRLKFGERTKEINTLKELLDSNYNITTSTMDARPFRPVNGSYVSEVYKELDKRCHSIPPLTGDDMYFLLMNYRNQALLSE